MATPAANLKARWLVWYGHLRLALLLAVLAFAATVPFVGSRTASLAELQGALEAGRVEQVSVIGALPPGATGSRTAHIVWQDGPITRVTTVRHLSDGSQGPPHERSDLDHVLGDLRHQLGVWDKQSSLSVVTETEGPMDRAPMAGWYLPVWMGQVSPWLWVVAVLLLATGPEPRWATRWAWFWAFIGPLVVVALPLFALGSVPLPGRPAPRRPGHRLTGGWAFLLVGLIVTVFDLHS